MVDWLLLWGATQAVGVLAYPILQDLAKEGAKDFAKDFFKDSLKHVVLREKDPRNIAAGKAIKEFLQLVQQELKDADVSEAQLQQYTKPLKELLNNKSVKEILGSAFKDDSQVLDTKTLAKTWYQLNLSPLPPEEFDWELVGKLYRKKVKAIIRELPELRAILDSQNLETIKQNIKELAGVSPEFDLRRYQEGLQERYSNLNLDSLDTSVYDYREKLKVWQIFTAQNVRKCQEFLPQVYEIPKEHQKRLRESNQLEAEVDPEKGERYKQVYSQQPICSVLDIVNEMWVDPPQPPLKRGENLEPSLLRGAGGIDSLRYVVILGDPGSGKSTLLQYIALNWAKTPLNNVIELPIPLLIELRSYSRDRISGQCKDFLEFFHKGNVICRLNQHQLHERLKAGKVLVMFDGLDEVFDPVQRKEVITGDIHRFTIDYPNVRVIVTSRIIGYKPQWLRDAQFRHFMLQDLESEQIQYFLYRWHELTFTDEADKVRKRERLQQAIKTSSAIGELAGNPLLLTMMAILNRNQELPRDRPELYKEASKVLLHQWDVEQKLLENPRIDSVAINYKDKQAMLRQVAYHMQAAEKGLAGNLISDDDLVKILTRYLKSIEVGDARRVARSLRDQLRERNFILCFLGADSYAFVHRTFLEYFCAYEFVERFGKRGLEGGLTLEELKMEVFGKHWQDESWHEVLRLIVGMIDTSFAGEIIQYLMALHNWDNLILAAECLLEVRNRSLLEATATKLINSLKSLTQYEDDDLPYDYEEEDPFYKIRTQAVTAIAKTWKDEPDTLSWLKTRVVSDQYWAVRQAAVREIARGWKENLEILSWLKSQGQKDAAIRWVIVQEIARSWKDDPNTLPWLKLRAQSDDYPYVRTVALQELARGWKDDPGLFGFFCDRAVSDPFEEDGENINPRQTALQAIITQYPNHPQTLPWLHDRVRHDLDRDLRRIIVTQLAKGWKNDPKTLPLLKDCIQSDDASMRHVAVEGLVMGWNRRWKDDPDILPLLKACVQCDDNWLVRRLTVQVLARGWKHDPETLPLLKQRASSDDDSVVRRAAVQELAHGWKDEPWMFEFLCNCALNDPFERKEDWEDNPRQLALDLIIKQYPDHPQTLPFLQDRAENDPDEKVRKFAREKLDNL